MTKKSGSCVACGPGRHTHTHTLARMTADGLWQPQQGHNQMQPEAMDTGVQRKAWVSRHIEKGHARFVRLHSALVRIGRCIKGTTELSDQNTLKPDQQRSNKSTGLNVH